MEKLFTEEMPGSGGLRQPACGQGGRGDEIIGVSKPSLDGVEQRIARADKYLGLIEKKVASLSAPDSHRLIGHFERDASEYVFRIEAPEFPSDLGILVSEVAHHLRSALDNLAWELVRARGGTPTRDGDVRFPIHKDKPAGDSWQETPLPGLRSEDRATVDAAQPYHYGPHWHRRHLLFLLAHLNNLDKHRSLHIGFKAIAFTIPLGDDPIRIPLHDGIADLIRFLPQTAPNTPSNMGSNRPQSATAGRSNRFVSTPGRPWMIP